MTFSQAVELFRILFVLWICFAVSIENLLCFANIGIPWRKVDN
jgi:hypothetical protein